jgi:osmoprotectant transport system substrate-binding protein
VHDPRQPWLTRPGIDGRARRRRYNGGIVRLPQEPLLACLYAATLAAKGFPVRVLPDLGTRELVDPALMNGLIQLVPKYAGSAVEFMSRQRCAQALIPAERGAAR